MNYTSHITQTTFVETFDKILSKLYFSSIPSTDLSTLSTKCLPALLPRKKLPVFQAKLTTDFWRFTTQKFLTEKYQKKRFTSYKPTSYTSHNGYRVSMSKSKPQLSAFSQNCNHSKHSVYAVFSPYWNCSSGQFLQSASSSI